MKKELIQSTEVKRRETIIGYERLLKSVASNDKQKETESKIFHLS